MFSSIYDIAVAPDGTIFVADRSPNRVRAYHPQGTDSDGVKHVVRLRVVPEAQ